MNCQQKIDIESVLSSYESDMQSIEDWCNSLYDSKFAEYFKDIRNLYDVLASKHEQISDNTLEQILTDIPLALFTVSERLNTLRTNREICKLKMKEHEALTRSELFNTYSKDCGYSKSDIPAMVRDSTINDQIVLVGLDGVINRVENEISFSRELIMSAKKIWDRRKNTENVNPVGPVVPDYTYSDLPDYDDFKSTDF